MSGTWNDIDGDGKVEDGHGDTDRHSVLDTAASDLTDDSVYDITGYDVDCHQVSEPLVLDADSGWAADVVAHDAGAIAVVDLAADADAPTGIDPAATAEIDGGSGTASRT